MSSSSGDAPTLRDAVGVVEGSDPTDAVTDSLREGDRVDPTLREAERDDPKLRDAVAVVSCREHAWVLHGSSS
jgi:hypothetical protein